MQILRRCLSRVIVGVRMSRLKNVGHELNERVADPYMRSVDPTDSMIWSAIPEFIRNRSGHVLRYPRLLASTGSEKATFIGLCDFGTH
jgi:hypothetical protein